VTAEYQAPKYDPLPDEKRPRFGDDTCPHTIHVLRSNKCAACGHEPEQP
jgi:hypothetical protein